MGYQIEVDFDVYKRLTWERQTEAEDYNAVLRRILDLQPKPSSTRVDNKPANADLPFVAKGVSFPVGTEFRARYRGVTYTAIVQDGALLLDGKRYLTPSSAAMHLTKGSVNGWIFWECKRPGDKSFSRIDRYRKP